MMGWDRCHDVEIGMRRYLLWAIVGLALGGIHYAVTVWVAENLIGRLVLNGSPWVADLLIYTLFFPDVMIDSYGIRPIGWSWSEYRIANSILWTVAVLAAVVGG